MPNKIETTTTSLTLQPPHFDGAFYGDTDFIGDLSVEETRTLKHDVSYYKIVRNKILSGQLLEVTYESDYRYRIDITKVYTVRTGVSRTRKSYKLYTGRYDESGQFIGQLREISDTGQHSVYDIAYPIFPDDSTFTERQRQFTSEDMTTTILEFQTHLDNASYEKETTEVGNLYFPRRIQTAYSGSYSKIKTRTYANGNTTFSDSYSGSSSYRKTRKTTITLHDNTKDVVTYDLQSSGSFNSSGTYNGTTTITETDKTTQTDSIANPFIGGYTLKTTTVLTCP